MCMEDYNIARQLKTNIYRATSGNGAANQTIPANADRVSVRLICDDSSNGILAAVSAQVLKPDAISVNVPLATITRNSVSNIDPGGKDTRLEDVGDILKGPLLLTTTQGQAYAIEVYLSVVGERSPDVTKLP